MASPGETPIAEAMAVARSEGSAVPRSETPVPHSAAAMAAVPSSETTAAVSPSGTAPAVPEGEGGPTG